VSDPCAAKKCRQPAGIIIRGLPLCEAHEAKTWDLLREGIEDIETLKKVVPRTRWEEITPQ